MTHTLHERVLTLAGLFQCAELVRQVANTNIAMNASIEACINSLFVDSPETVEEIYTSEAHLRTGLTILIQQMDMSSTNRDAELTRYVVALLYLEKKMSKKPALLKKLEDGIDVARAQAEYFSITHENVIASLAELYQKTVSTLAPKIMVSGDPNRLQDAATANLIRALLLAGIRSSVAWRQCGGTRFQLIFRRGPLFREARAILDKLPAIDTLV